MSMREAVTGNMELIHAQRQQILCCQPQPEGAALTALIQLLGIVQPYLHLRELVIRDKSIGTRMDPDDPTIFRRGMPLGLTSPWRCSFHTAHLHHLLQCWSLWQW